MFYKKMFFLLVHLLTLSLAIYTRPEFSEGLMNGFKAGDDAPEMTDMDIMRYCFEVATLLGVLSFMVFQLGEEIKNAGLNSFWKNLVGMPAGFQTPIYS